MSAPAVVTRPRVAVVGRWRRRPRRRSRGARAAADGAGHRARGSRPVRGEAAPGCRRRPPRRRRRGVDARRATRGDRPRPPARGGRRAGRPRDDVRVGVVPRSAAARCRAPPSWACPRTRTPPAGCSPTTRSSGCATNGPGRADRSPTTCRSASTSRPGSAPAVVDRLVEPLLGGVYAGHAHALSLRATMPALWDRATRGESLLAPRPTEPASAGSSPGRRPTTAPSPASAAGWVACPLCWPTSSAARGATLRTGAVVRRLERTAQRWRLVVGSAAAPEVLDAEAVLVCVPPAPAARLLAPHAPVAAARARRRRDGLDGRRDAGRGEGRARGPSRVGLPRPAGRGPHHQGEHVQLPQVGLDRRAVRRGRAPARVGRPGARGGRPPARRRRPRRRVARRGGRGPRSARCRASSTRTSSAGAAACRSTPSATSTRSPRSAPTSRGLPGVEVAGAAYDGVGIPAVVASATRAARATVHHLSTASSRRGDHPA